MKKCPKCKTDYNDETLLFCLHDGAPLKPDLSGEKTVGFQNTTVGETQGLSEPKGNLSGPKSIPPKEKSRSSAFWKLTTFGLLGILFVVIASFWLVFPERFKALSAAIPFPGFSFATQEGETESERQGKGGSPIKTNEKQVSNPGKTKNQETIEKKPQNKNLNEGVGIVGKWEITLKTPRRNFPLIWDLTQDEDGTINGISNSPFGREEIKGGKFEDGVLTVNLSRPLGLRFVGNVKGSQIEGKVITKWGPTTFKGSRAEEKENEEN